MFSNVGMNPYGQGGFVVTSQPAAATAPGTDTASAARGETGASRVRSDTARAVDPPRQAAPAASLRQDPGAGGGAELSISQRLAQIAARFTPGPDGTATEDAVIEDPADSGPAGPPPAFRRSLLEAQRAETIAPDPAPATISAPEPPDREVAEAGPTPEGAEADGAEAGGIEAGGIEAGGTEADGAAAAPGPGALTETPSDSSPSEAPDDTDPLLATIRRIIDDAAPAAVPPSAEARAEAEFTGLRRMAVPYDTATVDITR